jgi:Na+/melibiose symporter-like transporter
MGNVINNLGFASMQISHMSVVNQLTSSVTEKDRLINYRNAFTSFSTLFVLGASFIFSELASDGIQMYRYLSSLIILIGLSCNLLYIMTIDEVTLTNQAKTR